MPPSKRGAVELNDEHPTERPEPTRPNRVVIVAGTMGVAAIALVSRGGSIHVPDLIGHRAGVGHVGDERLFAVNEPGLALIATEVSACRHRDADLVIDQTPTPRTLVDVGTAIHDHLPSDGRRGRFDGHAGTMIGDICVRVVVQSGRDVDLVVLAWAVLDRAGRARLNGGSRRGVCSARR